jgi:branched-chain amino acid transport system ATP-binding protein
LASSLEVRAVDAGYGRNRVLTNVSLSINYGETVVLLGTNGNGKSTLINSIAGLLRPQQGQIVATLDGQEHELVGKPADQVANLGISLVPEGRRLFPRMTIQENLMLGANRKAARGDIKDNLSHCFDAFPVLKERPKQLAGSLSGGEQQMLALARALMSTPRILLIDEPSVGLAPIYVARLIDKIQDLKELYKLTILMAEQNFRQASRIADRGYVLVHGSIVFEGKTRAELIENDIVKKLYLGL